MLTAETAYSDDDFKYNVYDIKRKEKKMRTKAAVCRALNGPIEIEELELDEPKEKEVLVKTANAGWCHSDLTMWKGGYGVNINPFVLGHEVAGVVEKVGRGVTTVKPGDHVVAAWAAPCGQCEACVSGRTHTCLSMMQTLGTGKLLDGTSRWRDKKGKEVNHQLFVSAFSEYIVSPEISCVKIRDNLPLDQACLLGCCVPTGWGAAVISAETRPLHAVAVWGMGGVGLNVVQGAKTVGAFPIIAVDLEGSKEEIARKMGATHFINSSEEDPIPKIKELTDGKGVHRAFEAVGDSGAYLQAFYSLRQKGRLMAIGVVPVNEKPGNIPWYSFSNQEHIIQGVCYGGVRHQIDIPLLADKAARGELNVGGLITRHLKIEDINEVIRAMEKREIVGRWVFDF